VPLHAPFDGPAALAPSGLIDQANFGISGVRMMIGIFSPFTIGSVALATGVTGLLALAFIILFFTVGQPFGTLNDICIGLAAILSGLLAWMVYPQYHAQAPLNSQVMLILALAGALVALVGSVLVVFGVTGWFLAGLTMAAGYALIGLWLLGLSYSALHSHSMSHGLVIFGIVIGILMALGLLAIPGIFRGIDAWDTAPWYVNLGQASGLGYLILYPIWCIWLGRIFLLK